MALDEFLSDWWRIDEAAAWGIRRRAASAVVTETLDQMLAAIPATPGDTRVLRVIRGPDLVEEAGDIPRVAAVH